MCQRNLLPQSSCPLMWRQQVSAKHWYRSSKPECHSNIVIKWISVIFPETVISSNCVSIFKSLAVAEWPENQCVISWHWWRFLSSPCPDWFWSSPSVISSGNWGLTQGIEWLGHKVDYLCPSSAKVRNVWNCNSTYLYVFLALTLIK